MFILPHLTIYQEKNFVTYTSILFLTLSLPSPDSFKPWLHSVTLKAETREMKKRFLNLALALSRQKAETNFEASELSIYEDLHYIILCYVTSYYILKMR
jgi:hypothetical protein